MRISKVLLHNGGVASVVAIEISKGVGQELGANKDGSMTTLGQATSNTISSALNSLYQVRHS
jgi:hypothetical protein